MNPYSKEIYDNIPVIIPSYEPDKSLIILCEELIKAGIKNVIVLDDGSGEEYRGIFDTIQKKYNYTILRHAVNLGKGRALKEAFNYALNKNSGILGVVTADSDGQHTPEDIMRCMEALVNHPGSLILGCREFKGRDIPWKSKVGNELTKKVCGYLCGIKISDTQTGLRGIPNTFMKELLSVSGERFEFETNMLIACKEHISITEISIKTVYDSKTDHRTHFDPIRDSVRIYKIFGKIFMKYIFSSISSCILDLWLFALFCNIAREEDNFSYVIKATISARVVSAVYNYLINYIFVFKSRKNRFVAMVKYFLLVMIQMSVSALLVLGGVKIIRGIPEVYIKAVIDTVLFILNYMLQQRFIF